MDPDEYREHANRCRSAAERATEPIRGDFLAAAEVWDMLAAQWEWLQLFSGEAPDADTLDDRLRHRGYPHALDRD